MEVEAVALAPALGDVRRRGLSARTVMSYVEEGGDLVRSAWPTRRGSAWAIRTPSPTLSG